MHGSPKPICSYMFQSRGQMTGLKQSGVYLLRECQMPGLLPGSGDLKNTEGVHLTRADPECAPGGLCIDM